MLFLITCATIAGCDNYDKITLWGRHHLAFLRGYGEYHFGTPKENWLGVSGTSCGGGHSISEGGSRWHCAKLLAFPTPCWINPGWADLKRVFDANGPLDDLKKALAELIARHQRRFPGFILRQTHDEGQDRVGVRPRHERL